ncbi:MAG TPA: phosphoglycerate kinase [Candidatus Omnitrophota bacterium]|nr:phosphoglycerate kinase [Candidatus Omnitrophota bacterium]HPS37491.1 phosphoglycerate kinase [Candidatus Omnitrophota bacterium]
MKKKSVRDIDVRGKRVLMRVDFNVPMNDGAVQDDTRIKAALPTIRYVLDHGAKSLVLMSHLGDPKKDMQKAKEKAEKTGKPFDEKKYLEAKHKMAPVAERLSKLLGKEVKLAPACMGPETDAMVKAIPPGGILMLENTRFHKEETSKDPAEREKMGKALAQYGDIFVNDAFGSAHRAHASTESVAHFLPAVAGFLMEKELDYLLDKVVDNPERPFVALIGGAKVSSKIAVLESLLGKVDRLIVGGGMAYTFLKAKGLSVGASLVEDDMLDTARQILQKAYETHIYIYLPIDHIVTTEFSVNAEAQHVARGNIDADQMGMDIGPLTIQKFEGALKGARTVFWNGPVGVFEFPKFATGTMAMARTIASLPDCVTVIGGGDSVAAVNQSGVADKISHISTGGGASLELVEGKTLPGVAALLDK